MSEITSDDMGPLTGGRPQPPRLLVTDISRWVQRYSSMAAILAARYPNNAAELFAYLAQIVWAAQNYEGDRWVTYDRQFRREALARKDLNWSTPNHRLYNEAFTGWARSIVRCSYCLQDDHQSANRPRNPDHSLLGWLQDAALIPSRDRPINHSFPSSAANQLEICKRYKRGRCPDNTRCKYTGTRASTARATTPTPYAGGTAPGRSRSPLGRRATHTDVTVDPPRVV